MCKTIEKGLNRLKEELEYWTTQREASPEDEFSNHQYYNAQRALSEFSEIYKSQIEAVEKCSFLASK